MDHEMYGLKPEHRFFEQHPAVNDAIPNCICSGSVTIKVRKKECTASWKTTSFTRNYSPRILISSHLIEHSIDL